MSRLHPRHRPFGSRNETIRRAHAVHSIGDLQIEYSLISRAPKGRIFPALRELGIGVTACGVLSRGLLTGFPLAPRGDFRAHMPRFVGDNLARNRTLIETLNHLAAERGVAPANGSASRPRTNPSAVARPLRYSSCRH